MGFSEEEIAAINSRRQANRPQYFAQARSVRSPSPSSSSNSVVARPKPRSSSLRRDTSNTSLSQASDSSVPLPSHSRSNSNLSRQHSDASLSESAHSDRVQQQTTNGRSTSRSQAVTPLPSSQTSVVASPIVSPNPPRMPVIAQRLVQSPDLIQPVGRSSSPWSSQSGSSSSEKDPRPHTPPKRYHVANDSISTISSPPPAYKSPKRKDRSLDDINEPFTLPPPVTTSATLTRSITPNSSGSEGEGLTRNQARPSAATAPTPSSSSSSPPPATVVTRLSTLKAPRLSLHQDNLADLSSWSESLFSILPADEDNKATPIATSPPRPVPTKSRTLPITSSADVTPVTAPSLSYSRSNPTSATASTSTSTTTSSRTAALGSKTKSMIVGQCSLPPQKPVPLDRLPVRAVLPPNLPPASSTPLSMIERTTPLWDEVMSMVRSSGGTGDLLTPSSRSSPSTPLTPKSPPARDPPLSPSPSFVTSTGGCSGESEGDELNVGSGRDKENRDSNLSTITATPATVVRHVSVARRARANVIQSPLKDNEDREKESPVTPLSAAPSLVLGGGEGEGSRGVLPVGDVSSKVASTSVRTSPVTVEGDGGRSNSPQSLESASSESVSSSAALSSASSTSTGFVPGLGHGQSQPQGKMRPPTLSLGVTSPGPRKSPSNISIGSSRGPPLGGTTTRKTSTATNSTTAPYMESSPGPSPSKAEFDREARGLTSRAVRQIRGDEDEIGGGVAASLSPPPRHHQQQQQSRAQSRQSQQTRPQQ